MQWESFKIVNDLGQVSYPEFKPLQFDTPYLGHVSLPRLFFQGFFYGGFFSATYWFFKYTYLSQSWALTYLKSFFNKKKFLTSTIENPQQPLSRYYAVLYGTANRAGKAFAAYLAEKGFNLILIERSQQPLNDLEKYISDKFQRNTAPQIIKVVLDKFDQDSLINQLNSVKDLPVKLFINCKNSKKKPVNQKYEHQNEEEVEREVVAREEVYYTGKENIEGFAILVNIFLKNLLSSSQHPAVINVDNDEPIDINQIRQGQLFFQSTLRFQDTFTTLLGRKVKEIKTINVKINFKVLKNAGKEWELCNNTFAYLGLKDNLYIH